MSHVSHTKIAIKFHEPQAESVKILPMFFVVALIVVLCAGFVDVLEQHVTRQLGLKLQVETIPLFHPDLRCGWAALLSLQTMSLLRVSTPVLHAEATGRIKVSMIQ